MDGERELYVRRISLPDGLKEVVVMAGFCSETIRDGVTRAWELADKPADFTMLATVCLERLRRQCEELLGMLAEHAPEQEVGA